VLVSGTLKSSLDGKNLSSDEKNLTAVYQELCDSYRAIEDFRAKLLGFLPLATGGFFLLSSVNPLTGYLGPIGVFGFAVTVGLWCYELYGITKCHNLIVAGDRIEAQLGIDGQFDSRPREVAHLINEPFAAGIIYPAVGAAWMFLALSFGHAPVSPLQSPATWIAFVVFLLGFVLAILYNLWLGGTGENLCGRITRPNPEKKTPRGEAVGCICFCHGFCHGDGPNNYASSARGIEYLGIYRQVL
jgi:hypothetical protein